MAHNHLITVKVNDDPYLAGLKLYAKLHRDYRDAFLQGLLDAKEQIEHPRPTYQQFYNRMETLRRERA